METYEEKMVRAIDAVKRGVSIREAAASVGLTSKEVGARVRSCVWYRDIIKAKGKLGKKLLAEGVSQEEAARRAGIDGSTLSRYMTGKRRLRKTRRRSVRIVRKPVEVAPGHLEVMADRVYSGQSFSEATSELGNNAGYVYEAVIRRVLERRVAAQRREAITVVVFGLLIGGGLWASYLLN
jgi:transcriptional regulator with XRE-family HTH domain